MANFSNIFGLYGLSKQYLSQISHFGSVLKENVGMITELLRKANFKSKSMRFFLVVFLLNPICTTLRYYR